MKTIIRLSAILLLIGLANVAFAEPIVTESTSNSNVTTNGNNKTTVKSPPPSAIHQALIIVMQIYVL